jgi:hypothetical protein
MNKCFPSRHFAQLVSLTSRSPYPVASTIPLGDGITRVKRGRTSSRKNAALKSGDKRCRSSAQGNLRIEKVRRFGRQQNT